MFGLLRDLAKVIMTWQVEKKILAKCIRPVFINKRCYIDDEIVKDHIKSSSCLFEFLAAEKLTLKMKRHG